MYRLSLIILLFLVFGSCKKAPSDAVVFNGNYYKVYDINCSWANAIKKCEALGGHLVSIKNKDVNDFVFKLSKGKCLWIGATDALTEGDWYWQDGTKMIYNNWAPREPDDWKGKEDCTVIGWPADRFKNGKWGDTMSHKRDEIVGFICEWDTK